MMLRLKGLTLSKLYTWKAPAYGIYARVVDVSEVEQVRGSVRPSDTKQRVCEYCTKSLCVI